MTLQTYQTILNTLVLDSYLLPAHWVYDIPTIINKLTPLGYFDSPKTWLLAPGIDPKYNFHKTKVAGDNTHYGDQMFWLTEYISLHGTDLSTWGQFWYEKAKAYTGYSDHASKDTIASFESNQPHGKSDTTELGGIARFIPLLAVSKSLDEFVQLSKQQSKVTHENELCDEMAEFYATWAWKAHQNPSVLPSTFVADILASKPFMNLKPLVQQGIDTFKTGAVVSFHPGCAADGAVPLSVYLVFKYEKEGLLETVRENIKKGGDSATRSMVITAVLSPYSAFINKPLPNGLIEEYKKKPLLDSYVNKYPKTEL